MGTRSGFDEFWPRLRVAQLRGDRGASAAEYALLLALIMVAIVVAVKGLGPVLVDLLRSYPDLSSS